MRRRLHEMYNGRYKKEKRMEQDVSRIVEELAAVRKELEKISLILEYVYVPQHTVERKKVDGRTVIIDHPLQAPLEEIRKALGKCPQCQTR